MILLLLLSSIQVLFEYNRPVLEMRHIKLIRILIKFEVIIIIYNKK